MAKLGDLYSVALVTGSSSGFGYALVDRLLSAGVQVIGVSRHPNVFEGCPRYHPVVCDLGDPVDVEAMLEKVFNEFPSLNLVVNNAGFGILSELSDSDTDSIEAQLRVMLVAPAVISARATAYFKSDLRKFRGCLLQVSSLATDLPLPLMPLYNASKAGLSALSESLILDEIEERFDVIDLRLGDYNTNFAGNMKGRAEWAGVDLRVIMDAHHEKAPEISHAVNRVIKRLENPRSGIFRVGVFFQAKMAPLGCRLLPVRWLRRLIRAYYRR